MMGVLAVGFGHPLEQLFLHLDDILARRQACPVGQPEYMRVDRDRRLAKRGVQHNICGFAADTG